MTTRKKVGGYAWNNNLNKALEFNRQAQELLKQAHQIVGQILDEKPDPTCLAVLLGEMSHQLWGASQMVQEELYIWQRLKGITPPEE